MDGLVALGRALMAGGYDFVTPTPATHARVNARAENAWATSLADVFGWSRPFRAGVVPDAVLALMSDARVLAPQADGFRSLVRFSTLDGMLFVHSAYPTDAADSVFFGPDTYRFANAIAAWLAHGAPVGRAIDIGCGAGPGAAVIARARPAATVIGADINDAALHLTRVNAALNGVAVDPVHSDLLDAAPGQFDLIVANPPYLADPRGRAYRHGGGPLGAALSERILDTALERLAPYGTLLLYTGAAIVNGADPFRAAVAERFPRNGVEWRYAELDPDVFGEELDSVPYRNADRIAAVLLTATHTG